MGACAHFNPYNTLHGDISDNVNNRHVGDLGNILVDSHGNAKYSFNDKIIRLRGKRNIVGRSVVIHADEDDLEKPLLTDPSHCVFPWLSFVLLSLLCRSTLNIVSVVSITEGVAVFLVFLLTNGSTVSGAAFGGALVVPCD